MQVVAFAPEQRVRLHVDVNVQIAGAATAPAGVSLAPGSAAVRRPTTPGGNVHRDRLAANERVRCAPQTSQR